MRPNEAREYIEHFLHQMKEGDEVQIHGHLFRSAYPCGWPSIYNTPEQSFLSKQVGSSWGAWTVEQLPFQDVYKIGKHPCGDKRVYVDPDREHLYTKQPDGSLKHIDED